MIRPEVVLGPAPCTTCGAWVEWLGVGPWVSIESHEPHDCRLYLHAREAHGVLPEEIQVARWREPDYTPARAALLEGLGPLAQAAVRWLSSPQELGLGMPGWVIVAALLASLALGLLTAEYGVFAL